jgi:hypothetical protein
MFLHLYTRQRRQSHMRLMRSAPEISTKPLARALRKFAAQRDCLTISVIKTGSSLQASRTVCFVARPQRALIYHGACGVPKLEVQYFAIGDARSSVAVYHDYS